jgi:hypothetical protein
MYSRAIKFSISSVPSFGPQLLDETKLDVSWINSVGGGWIKQLVEGLRPVVPGWADRWLDALQAWPLQMIVALILAAIPFAVGTFLAQRIHDRAWFAWHPSKRGDYFDWLVESARNASIRTMASLVATVLLLGLAFAFSWRPILKTTLSVVVIALLAVLMWRLAIARKLAGESEGIKAGATPLPSTPTLRLSRALRQCAPLVAIYGLFAEKIVPIFFALAMLYGVIAGVNHLIVRFFCFAGLFCPDEWPRDPTFDTRQLCWDSGISVKKGRTYEVEFQTEGNWLDRTIPADVTGVTEPTWVHFLAMPLKRSWGVNWLAPILRVGRIGDVEYLMPPADHQKNVARLRLMAPADAELFLYVNDTIVAIPWATQHFYENNHGTGKLGAREVPDPAKQ